MDDVPSTGTFTVFPAQARTTGLDTTSFTTNHSANTNPTWCHPSYGTVSVYPHPNQRGLGSFYENAGGSQPRELQQTYAWSSNSGGTSNPPRGPPSPECGADAKAFIWSAAPYSIYPVNPQQHYSGTPAYSPSQSVTTPPATYSGYSSVDFGSTSSHGCYASPPSTLVPTPPPISPDGAISVSPLLTPPAYPIAHNNVIRRGSFFLEGERRPSAVLHDVYTVPLADLSELMDIRFITKVDFFQCFFDNCGKWVPDSKDSLERHLAENHGIVLRGDQTSIIRCGWTGCRSPIKRGNFPRHLRKHLEDKWGCSLCGQSFSRSDSIPNHSRTKVKCSGARPVKLVSPRAYRAEVRGSEAVLTRAASARQNKVS